MIQHILLVAMREFRQIAATRSFWLTLFILPAALAIGPIAGRLLDESDTRRVMLIDRSGGAGDALAARIALDEQRAQLSALSRYARRYDLARADPSAPWASHDRWYGDAEVEAFFAGGGVERATAQMARIAPPETPEFDAPDPAYALVPAPPVVAQAAPEALDAALQPWLNPSDADEQAGVEKIDYAVLIPADFGTGTSPVRIWSDGRMSSGLVDTVQQVLTRDLRTRYLTGAGLDSERAAAASSIAPAIAISTPEVGAGRERVLIRSALPLVMSYMLLMALMLSGNWMLQGVIEERSNKLLETVLACVSPNELMYGKLVGTVATGLLMVLFWVLCGVAAAYATPGSIALFIRQALEPLSSPGMVATIIYFFLAGYLLVSMIYLALGAMAESARDAQTYLTPVILVIMLPFFIILQAVISDTGGPLVQVMTWIPLYTPFVMLARLGTGVPLWEVLGAGALLAAFLVLEFIFLGRVFRQSLLSAGEKMSLARIGELMRRRREA